MLELFLVNKKRKKYKNLPQILAHIYKYFIIRFLRKFLLTLLSICIGHAKRRDLYITSSFIQRKIYRGHTCHFFFLTMPDICIVYFSSSRCQSNTGELSLSFAPDVFCFCAMSSLRRAALTKHGLPPINESTDQLYSGASGDKEM